MEKNLLVVRGITSKNAQRDLLNSSTNRKTDLISITEFSLVFTFPRILSLPMQSSNFASIWITSIG